VDDPETERLWTAYLQAERESVKETRVEALERLVGRLESLAEDTRTGWSLALAARVVDDHLDVPIRFPLFRRVLLPALIDGVLAQRPGCARWLADFEPLLFHSKEESERLPEGLRNPVGLLKEALRVDPADLSARSKLIGLRASYLGYTLHELPSGVLFGANGASADECGELLDVLAEFRADLEAAGRAGEYEKLLQECRRHFEGYREYLEKGCPGGSYEAYLKASERG
jgi:hypothetical protein